MWKIEVENCENKEELKGPVSYSWNSKVKSGYLWSTVDLVVRSAL